LAYWPPKGLALCRGGRKARPSFFARSEKKRRAEQTCEPRNIAQQGEAAAEAQKKEKTAQKQE